MKSGLKRIAIGTAAVAFVGLAAFSASALTDKDTFIQYCTSAGEDPAVCECAVGEMMKVLNEKDIEIFLAALSTRQNGGGPAELMEKYKLTPQDMQALFERVSSVGEAADKKCGAK